MHNWGFYFSDKKEYFFPHVLALLLATRGTGGIFTFAWTRFIQGLLFYYSAKGFAGYSVWKSLRDDLFKMFCSFFCFVLTPHHKWLKLPQSAELFCEMLMFDLSIIRGNLQGWNVQLQTAILHLINNSLGKQAGIDFKDGTFIEKRNRQTHIFWWKKRATRFGPWQSGTEMFHCI